MQISFMVLRMAPKETPLVLIVPMMRVLLPTFSPTVSLAPLDLPMAPMMSLVEQMASFVSTASLILPMEPYAAKKNVHGFMVTIGVIGYQ